MVTFKAEYQTKNITKGTNGCQYIILHHTGGLGLKGNLNVLLGKTSRKVSAHFLIDTNGDIYKLADPRQITRHAGSSVRGTLWNLNKYSIGIEVIGPDLNGKFTDEQYVSIIELVKELKSIYHIPMVNILKHSDVTRIGSYDKKLRDGVSLSRKPDIKRTLWADRGFKNFKERRRKHFL